MNQFNFKSQPYTSREQSERLLALGLKKENADIRGVEGIEHTPTYAWSLHRLIEMADTAYLGDGGRDDDNELWMCLDRCYCWNNHESFYNINLYGSLIDCIEWLIKEGYFNKEYLV